MGQMIAWREFGARQAVVIDQSSHPNGKHDFIVFLKWNISAYKIRHRFQAASRMVPRDGPVAVRLSEPAAGLDEHDRTLHCAWSREIATRSVLSDAVRERASLRG
jgi:hypothetical protein